MTKFNCMRVLGLGGVIAGGLLIGGAAYAQKPPPFVEVDSMTITAPKTIFQNRDGVTEQLVSMSVKVPYGDLNMQTPEGQTELNKRVNEAANYVCDTLAAKYPTGDPEPFYCAKQAIGDAKPQVLLASAPH